MRSPAPSGTGWPANGTGGSPAGAEFPQPMSGPAARTTRRHAAGKVKVDFMVRLSIMGFIRGDGGHFTRCQKTIFRRNIAASARHHPKLALERSAPHTRESFLWSCTQRI